MKILGRLNAILLGVERGFLVLLFSLMIVLAFSLIIMRNVLSVGLTWADPLLRNAVLWLGFLGASLATQHDKHIKIDLAGRYLKPKAAAVVGIVTDLFTLVICLLLSDASLTFVRNEMEFRDTLVTIGEFAVPSWWSQVILPVGFVLIALRILVRIIHRFGELSGRVEAARPAGAGGDPA